MFCGGLFVAEILRVLDLGLVSAPRSQALFHGIASVMRAGDDPVLTLVSPERPYVCIGMHQDVVAEVDEAYCRDAGLPVLRRHVGGGAVYLDHNQLFFHFIYPVNKAPRRVTDLYAHFVAPVLATYQALGIAARLRPINDIHVNDRKIGGTGAAQIGDATIFVGSFMLDFDVETMARCLKVPSEKFRDKLRGTLRTTSPPCGASWAQSHRAMSWSRAFWVMSPSISASNLDMMTCAPMKRAPSTSGNGNCRSPTGSISPTGAASPKA